MRRIHTSVLVLLALLAGPVRADTPLLVPCSGDAVPDAAARTAETFVLARWLMDGASVYAAFDVKAPPTNPFDLAAAKAAPPEPIKGHIWGQGLACRAAAQPNAIVMRYFTSVYSFNEGMGWSPPQRGGQLHVLVLIRQGEGWRVVDRSGEEAIFLPGAVLTKPALTDIPPARTAGGAPCPGTRLWSGQACVRPSAIESRATRTR